MAELRARRLAVRNDAPKVDAEKDCVEFTAPRPPQLPVQYSRERLQAFIGGTLFLPTWRVVLLWYGLVSGLVLSIMDLRLYWQLADFVLVILYSIVSTATYTIARDLEGGLGDATWLILAYTITYVGSTIIIARLSDVFGRRWTVTASFVIFITTSAGCGFAQTLNQLIAMRAVQGVGGAGLYTMAMVVLPEISPVKLLPALSSLIGMAVAVGSVLGPILGGTITEDADWRWIFWINVPLAIVAVIAFVIACPSKVRGQELSQLALSRLDWTGCFLMLLFSTLFVFGLQEAAIGAFPWNSTIIVITLVVGLLSGCVLVFWQFVAAKRFSDLALILPIRIITDRVLLSGILSTLSIGFCHELVLFNLPLRLQIVNLNSPKSAGIHILPFLGAVAVGSTISGSMSSRNNYTFYTFVFASACVIIGSGILTTLHDDFAISPKMFGFSTIFGFGTGMAMASVTLMANLQSDARDHAIAQGIVSQARVLGGSVGVAASNAVFNHQLKTRLSGDIPHDQLSQIQTNSEVVSSLTLVQQNDVRITFASSFSESMRVCLIIAVVGLLACLFTYQRHPPNIRKKERQMEDLIIACAKKRMAKADAGVRGQV